MIVSRSSAQGFLGKGLKACDNPSSLKKDVRKLLKDAESKGCIVFRGKRHYKVRCPEGRQITVSSSPSDHRVLHKIRKDFRKVGIMLNPGRPTPGGFDIGIPLTPESADIHDVILGNKAVGLVWDPSDQQTVKGERLRTYYYGTEKNSDIMEELIRILKKRGGGVIEAPRGKRAREFKEKQKREGKPTFELRHIYIYGPGYKKHAQLLVHLSKLQEARKFSYQKNRRETDFIAQSILGWRGIPKLNSSEKSRARMLVSSWGFADVWPDLEGGRLPKTKLWFISSASGKEKLVSMLPRTGKSKAAKGEPNPASFSERPHNWDEVLIQKDGVKKTRRQIRDYYRRNEKKIWPYLKGQTVMIILAPKRNQFVRRRHLKGESFIKLTKLKGMNDPNSFEYWINRRVIEFHPTLTTRSTPILWLDLDMHTTKSEAARKKLLGVMRRAVPQLKKIFKEMGVKRVHVYTSGTSGGLHLEGDFDKSKPVDALRRRFTKALKEEFAGDPRFTTGIAKSGQIRLDTTTLHTMGSLRSPYSMTVTGSVKRPIK